MHYNISSIILYPQQWHMYTKNCQLLKVFNDVTNTLSVIYYHTTNLFIIESFNIVGTFDEYMTQEPELVSFIEIIKSKWLDYYQNILIIYLLGIIFDQCYKLDYLSDCLEAYYKSLSLLIDVPTLVKNARQLFHSLYDEYVKFYCPSLNVNFEQSDVSLVQTPIN